ncbi:unnamed protein product, partial [Polarella glacialis]
MQAHYVVAIPLLSYGHGNGTPMDESEIRSRLQDFPAARWNQEYLVAINLAAFFRFVRLGWELCGTATRTTLPLLYIEQHRALLHHDAIGGLPWGYLTERRCNRLSVEGCPRRRNRQGGFAFGWIGPWSCTRSLPAGISPATMQTLWRVCNATGSCEACRLLVSLEILAGRAA